MSLATSLGVVSCGRSASSSTSSGGADAVSCPRDSAPIWGYPKSASGDCVDVDAARVLGCAGGTLPNGFTNCVKRLADGSLWTVAYSNVLDSAEWTPCSSEESQRLQHSCPFESCAVPPSSACNRQDTCDQVSCGGVQFDDDGCQRPPCTSEVDCTEAESCVETFVFSLFCSYRDPDSCQCSGPGIARTASYCVPNESLPASLGSASANTPGGGAGSTGATAPCGQTTELGDPVCCGERGEIPGVSCIDLAGGGTIYGNYGRCREEGEGYDGRYVGGACCEPLVAIPPSEPELMTGSDCSVGSLSGFVCAACGDGTCDGMAENACNCPADCPPVDESVDAGPL